MATTAAGAPFQQPVAPVAPFTPFQSIGFGETLGLQGMAQPYFNTAGSYLAGSAAPITGAEVANYYNPMADSVTRQMQNIFGQQNVQNTGNLVQSAGGVGADRVAVGQANMANQQALAAGQTYAGLYQQALAAAEQNKQMQAGAGFAFGQMGPAAQAAQQNAVNQLLGVGAQQQGLTQQELNAIYQNQLARIAYPFQTGQYLAGITGGLAPAMGGTTQGQYYGQTTYPAPSGLAQALGLGAAGLGLMGQMGGIPGMGAMGLAATGQMPFGSAMQYMPGQSAYGATPSYQNGGYYPMFDEGGAVDPNYGDLAKREKYKEYAPMIAPAAEGNPIAETFLKDVGFDDGGLVQGTQSQLPPQWQPPRNLPWNNWAGRPSWARPNWSGRPPGNPGQPFGGGEPTPAAPTGMQTPSMLDIPPLPQFPALMPNVQLPSWQQSAPMQSAPFVPANQFARFPQAGFDDGGKVIPVGDVVPFNQFHNTRTLQDAMDRIENRKQPGAQGFAGAPPEAVEQAHDAGVLKIHPLHGFDDGGTIPGADPMSGSPMSLNIDPTNSGLPFPGAGRVGRSPVPQTQLPQGQPGKSGPYGQFIYGLGSHSPSMPQGGGQSPMGGGLGGLGQLGGSIGKLFGGMGGGAGAADAGAGVDFAGLTGDLGASIDEIGALLPLAAAHRGGRMDTGGATTDMNPHIPLSQDPDFIDWQRQQKHDQIQLPVPPAPNRDVNGIPMSALGGGMGGEPPGGALADEARRWQGFESRFPKDAPPVDWRYEPHIWEKENRGRTAAGGAVDPMRPGAGYGDDDVDPTTTTTGDESSWGNPLPMMGQGAKQIGRYLADKWNAMSEPGAPPVIPPEAQSHYPSEGHPVDAPNMDRPFMGVPSDDESLVYGPGVGRRVGPAETLSDTTGRAPSVIQRTGAEVTAPGPHEAPPLDPFGHGVGAPGAQGAMGQPGSQLDMAPFRRATIEQESSGNASNVTTTRDRHGNVQRALGLYGIMDFNLPQWSREALGRSVSPQEFLANPELQTAIYDYKMGQYIRQYGVEGAGRAWLGGPGSLNAPMASDPLGTRVGDYGRHFAQLVQRPGSTNAQGMITNGMRPSTNVEDFRDQGPMGSAPRNVPFPNAADPNSVARRWTMSPWAALTNAGVQMAQSRGPIGSVIAGGIGAAQKTFAGQQQELNSEQAINDKAEQLAILAQAHLNQYTRMTPYQQEEIAERKQYHNAILNLRGSTVWNQERTKLEAEPAWMGRNEEDKDVETARRITEGRRVQQQGQGPEKPPGTPDNAQYSQKTGTWWTPDGKEWGKPESAGAG